MDKITETIRLLEKKYPDTKTALKFSNSFQLLIATVLSAQATDNLVNKTTAILFKKYKTPEDFAGTSPEEIMNDIKSINFYRNKARSIKKLSGILVRDYNGKVPDSMETLVQLPGVARKTANVVLSQGFGKMEGIVVDTHVKRVSRRLGLTRNENPEKIEKDLMNVVPKNEWISFPFRLILHGRSVCKARKTDCRNCILNKVCLYHAEKNENIY